MAVKDETAHWQLRSLIGVSTSNTVYYPAGEGNLHIQEFDAATQRSETIAFLSFSPRCLVARNGWLCCGGENGEFIAIRSHALGSRGRASSGPVEAGGSGGRGGRGGRGGDSGASGSGGGGDGDGGHNSSSSGSRGAADANANANGGRSIFDEEYDNFDMRMGEPLPSLVAAPSRMAARSRKFGAERVNCITIWTPPSFVPLHPGAYTCPTAVLANNDKHITLVNLETVEELDVLEYPDCVNRGVISPDGRLLATVSDDPYLYIHERVEKDVATDTHCRFNHRAETGADDSAGSSSSRKQYEWKLLAKHHLRGQSREDMSYHRGSFAACFSNTGRYLAAGTQYGVILVFETALLARPSEGIIACFSSSSPNTDAGAVREMSFCPGPYDLLAWSENHGAVGVADIRDGFVSRQILGLGDAAAYEHVSVNQVTHINDDLVEANRRRLQQQLHSGGSGSNANADDSTMRDILEGSSPSPNEQDASSEAMRISEALDQYFNAPFVADDMAELVAGPQERRRRREREQREQLIAQLAARESRDRERLHELLGRRVRSRPMLGLRSTSNNDNGSSSTTNNNGGGGAARSREQAEATGTAISDMLGVLGGPGSRRSTRNALEAAEAERRWGTPTPPGLLHGTRPAGMAIPTVENEGSGSDEDAFSSRAPAQATSRRRQPWAWPFDLSPLTYGSGSGEGGGGGSGGISGSTGSRTLDFLHGYTLRSQTRRTGLAASARRERTMPTEAPANEASLLMEWDGGLSIPSMNVRRTHESAPLELKDSNTAGLAWSDDGSILFIGTEGGIFEFRVNVKCRMFFPSVTMR